MNGRSHRTRRVVWGVLLLALAASGCRTYGGYGSQEELLGQIQQATQRFAEDLERARGDQEALQRAAASNPALADVAERYAGVVERQAALLEEHEALAETASAGGNILFAWVGPDVYRRLHSTYGAILSDQQIVRDRYADVLTDLQQALGATNPAEMPPPQSRYQVAPSFYERLREASGRRSVAEILAQARAAMPADAAPAPSQ